MSDIIAYHFVGERRDNFVKSHGNSKDKKRPYARISGEVVREAMGRAATEKNAERLAQDVRDALGPEAAAFEKGAAQQVIAKVREEEGTRPKVKENMAVQCKKILDKWYMKLNVPDREAYLFVEMADWKTQVRLFSVLRT